MEAAEPTDLKRAAARGVAWKIAAELVVQITRLAVLLILAHLLVPAQFGVARIVMAFVIFVPRFADLGLGAALIQARTLTEVERSTVFTFTLQPVDGGTDLTVVESGFDHTSAPAANLESHRGGWETELDSLRALLESGS